MNLKKKSVILKKKKKKKGREGPETQKFPSQNLFTPLHASVFG